MWFYLRNEAAYVSGVARLALLILQAFWAQLPITYLCLSSVFCWGGGGGSCCLFLQNNFLLLFSNGLLIPSIKKIGMIFIYYF